MGSQVDLYKLYTIISFSLVNMICVTLSTNNLLIIDIKGKKSVKYLISWFYKLILKNLNLIKVDILEAISWEVYLRDKLKKKYFYTLSTP